jgi:hypothetical protein
LMVEAIRSTPARASERVFRFLERVEHRVATSPEEREAAFRLRYDAYTRIGFLKPRADDKLYDSLFDDDPMAWILLTFVDGELAGTVRVNVGACEEAVLPGLQAFSDVLAPRLRAGKAIVEFTRLAVRISVSRVDPELAYVVMRPGFMAAQHFDADFAVATPREEHIPFYKRTFGATLWCAPRFYPGLTAKLACMGADYRAVRGIVETRHPFYRSTPAERVALFGIRGFAPNDRLSTPRAPRLRSSGAELPTPA